jgi:hypothetical protein
MDKSLVTQSQSQYRNRIKVVHLELRMTKNDLKLVRFEWTAAAATAGRPAVV